MTLRRFNDRGLLEAHAWLDLLAGNPRAAIPDELLTHHEWTERVGAGGDVECPVWPTRFSAARYLADLLSSCTQGDVLADSGLWAWLSLFHFDQTCPPDGQGNRKPGERSRHIPDVSNFQRYYRHLLAGPFRIYVAHRLDPHRAQILLCGPVHAPGDIVEQLASRQELVTNPNFMEAATRLYFDPLKHGPKRGAASRGTGSARRLAEVVQQFELTWDFYSTSADEILALLPAEFERFRATAGSLDAIRAACRRLQNAAAGPSAEA